MEPELIWIVNPRQPHFARGCWIAFEARRGGFAEGGGLLVPGKPVNNLVDIRGQEASAYLIIYSNDLLQHSSGRVLVVVGESEEPHSEELQIPRRDPRVYDSIFELLEAELISGGNILEDDNSSESNPGAIATEISASSWFDLSRIRAGRRRVPSLQPTTA